MSNLRLFIRIKDGVHTESNRTIHPGSVDVKAIVSIAAAGPDTTAIFLQGGHTTLSMESVEEFEQRLKRFIGPSFVIGLE